MYSMYAIHFMFLQFGNFWLLLKMSGLNLAHILRYRTVRRSGLGVVNWTCDAVLELGQRFDFHSQCSFYCNHFR